MQTSIIDEADQAFLASRNDLSRSPAHPGYVMVHKKRLCPGSLREFENETRNMKRADRTQYDPFVPIPEYFESSVCLRYLGLDDATADKLWKAWDEDEDQDREKYESVQDDAVKHISKTDHTKDTDSADDRHWHDLLSRIGVNDDFRRNLMDPHYKDLRLTNTCKYWVKYFFDHRKHTLSEIHRFSRERSKTAEVRLGRGPKTCIWSMAQEEKPGHVTLWSAQAFHRHGALALNVVAWKVKDWRCLGKSGLSGARDFTPLGVAYFTPQRDVALHSLGWHKKNDANAGYLLIRVVVPLSSIEGLEEGRERIQMLSTDPHWQDVVSYSRSRSLCVGEGHDSQANAIRRALLIHGHMAKGLDRTEIGSRDSPSAPVVPQVSSEPYLNHDGTPAVQYAFRLFHQHFVSFAETALKQHEVAYVDSKDVAEIEQIWDVKDRTTGQ
ncbi:hypothetical protein PG993_005909 [Apiospora rasikravindrae]|uniref:Uncharacterized protein n=1 Tax=Apiospora rasikravindrae TaxID=990691 RepID=A0ABR1TA44_9PEZI